MDNQTLQRIKDILNRSQRVAVAVGKNPTIDDMGAALALFLSLQGMGKTASIVSATEPLVEVSNLVGIDKVKTRFEADGADLVVSFPYKEGEIEKVSYTIDNGYLNIVVKAGEQGLTFQEQDVKYIRGGGSGGQLDALFSVGVARLSDLQGMFDMDTLKDVTIVNIDNKQDNQGYGDVILVSPRFSSVSEQIAQLLADLNTEPDIDVAQNLLDGISYATENFQSSQTSFLAFEMAGVLMRQGAVRSRLQPAPRRDFAAQQMPSAMPSLSQQPQPRQSMQSGQGGASQPQRRGHGQQDRRQQFEERRQQFQERRAQQQTQQSPHAGTMQNPAASAASMPNVTHAPMAGQNPAMQPRFNQPVQPAAPQPRFTQPAPQPAQQQPATTSAASAIGGQNPGGQQQANEDLNPPSDWLTPKVYKGSTNI